MSRSKPVRRWGHWPRASTPQLEAPQWQSRPGLPVPAGRGSRPIATLLGPQHPVSLPPCFPSALTTRPTLLGKPAFFPDRLRAPIPRPAPIAHLRSRLRPQARSAIAIRPPPQSLSRTLQRPPECQRLPSAGSGLAPKTSWRPLAPLTPLSTPRPPPLPPHPPPPLTWPGWVGAGTQSQCHTRAENGFHSPPRPRRPDLYMAFPHPTSLPSRETSGKLEKLPEGAPAPPKKAKDLPQTSRLPPPPSAGSLPAPGSYCPPHRTGWRRTGSPHLRCWVPETP